VPCALPKVYFQFESDADVGSFTINYSLVAANIREWREGKLNVKITLRDLPSPPQRRCSPSARMTISEGAAHRYSSAPSPSFFNPMGRNVRATLQTFTPPELGFRPDRT
jgi:hypothetical protein